MSNINYRLAAEVAFFKHYVSNIYPSGVCSYVSDTYDFWEVISFVAEKSKEEILNRKPDALGNAKVVFRPDSGDPVEVLCGKEVYDFTDYLDDESDEDDIINLIHDEILESNNEWSGLFKIKDTVYKAEWSFWEASTSCEWSSPASVQDITFGEYKLKPADKGAVECLWDIFGGSITKTGHRMLNPRVGLIYGDSITLEKAKQILQRLTSKGFASGNVVFGVGSFTYQYNTRDTFGFAVKSTYGVINGEEHQIFKDPVTDNGIKKSARGLIVVNREMGLPTGKLFMVDKLNNEKWIKQQENDELQVVFANGVLINETSLEDIRARVNKQLD